MEMTMLDEPKLTNEHGARIDARLKAGNHYTSSNAFCHKGCCSELMVAPAIFRADHKKGDPVMVCGDHGAHAYRFSDLKPGLQAKP